MGETEDLTRAVVELRREVEELRQVLTALVEMVFEDDYSDEPLLDRKDMLKIVPEHRNLYN